MYSNYNGVFTLTFKQSMQYFFISRPLLIRFMVHYDITKDLNMFLSFPDQAIPLTLKNDSRIILGSNQKNLSALRLGKKLCILI